MIIEVEALTDLNVSVTMQASPAVSLVKENTINVSVPLVGIPGPSGPQGVPGEGFEQSFESTVGNCRDYDVIDSSFSASTITKTYDAGNGDTIIVTINFDINGKPTTKVLSGSGVPAGIATTCTYDFTGRTIPLKTYT